MVSGERLNDYVGGIITGERIRIAGILRRASNDIAFIYNEKDHDDSSEHLYEAIFENLDEMIEAVV